MRERKRVRIEHARVKTDNASYHTPFLALTLNCIASGRNIVLHEVSSSGREESRELRSTLYISATDT